MDPKIEKKFTKYEIARILGARSLQLAMDAPVLLKMTKEEEEELNYNTLKIAEKEIEAEVLPITVRRPLPKKSERSLKKLSEEEIKEKLEKEAESEKKEVKAEKELPNAEKIGEESEIMEMAQSEEKADTEEETEEGVGEDF